MGTVTKKIISYGIVLLLFYEAIIYFLMPQGKIPEWIDLRVTKEYISLGLALLVTVFAWLEVGMLRCPNKWALFFLIFLFVNLSKSPIGVINPVVDVSLLGNYSAEFKIFSFFMMFCAVSSCSFTRHEIDSILEILFWCAIGMSFYMILQAFNLDQIMKPKPEYFSTGVKGIKVGGFFGQPTLTVPFLAMSIPFAVYFKRYLWIVPIAVALLLTGSDFAFVSMGFVGMAYFRKNKFFLPGIVCIAVTCVILAYFKPHGFFSDNGRFNVWMMILKDVFTGEINGVPVRIGLFGAGMNNFGELFPALHNTAYTMAHNEFLQILWCGGVVGLYLFVAVNCDVLRHCLDRISDSRYETVGISLGVLVLCAGGTFVFQLGVYQFITVLLAGLIYQSGVVSYGRKCNQ